MNHKNSINKSIELNDEYFKYSNSNNHSQLEAIEEFAIEEDMMDTQKFNDDVQIFNTQNFYNRQHYVGKRVVSEIDSNE